MKEENKTTGREVVCMKCKRQFKTYIMKPQCSQCRSTRIQNIEDVPKTYGGQELINLRKEHNQLKKDFNKIHEFNMKVFDKIKHRLNSLEAKV